MEVILKDIAFEPAGLEVKAGETVRFILTNQGKLPHEFNLGDAAMHAAHQQQMLAMAGMSMNHEGMDHGAMGGHGHDGGNTVLVQPGQRAELTDLPQVCAYRVRLQRAGPLPGRHGRETDHRVTSTPRRDAKPVE